MSKEPKTVSEHLIALYGHIKGLTREVNTIKNNHLKHMHDDIEKIHGKVDKLLYIILGALGIAVITLVELFYGK